MSQHNEPEAILSVWNVRVAVTGYLARYSAYDSRFEHQDKILGVMGTSQLHVQVSVLEGGSVVEGSIEIRYGQKRVQ